MRWIACYSVLWPLICINLFCCELVEPETPSRIIINPLSISTLSLAPSPTLLTSCIPSPLLISNSASLERSFQRSPIESDLLVVQLWTRNKRRTPCKKLTPSMAKSPATYTTASAITGARQNGPCGSQWPSDFERIFEELLKVLVSCNWMEGW